MIAASLDPTIFQQGNLRSCKACQSDTFEANVVCHQCGTESEPCAISGKSDHQCRVPSLPRAGYKLVRVPLGLKQSCKVVTAEVIAIVQGTPSARRRHCS